VSTLFRLDNLTLTRRLRNQPLLYNFIRMIEATPSPIETVLAGSGPPWRPKVAGYAAFLLGPIAGALVAAASFRRMGQLEKAQKTVFYTLLLCIAFLVVFELGMPADAPIKKIIWLAVAGAGYSVFPSIVREDYLKWRAANPAAKPRNDWAAVGWGLLGVLIYLAIGALIALFRPYTVWRP
jgi:hypothetical protein